MISASPPIEVVVRVLLRSGAEKNYRTPEGGKTALQAAAALGACACRVDFTAHMGGSWVWDFGWNV